MYAVVSSGGKQYRVEAGTELTVERLAGDAGTSITFDRVLLVGDGDTVTVGTPTVDGATVSGTVLGEALGPKLIVFKFKQKATYRRKNGHRQHLTRVRIDEISAGGTGSKARAAKADAAEAKAEKADAGDATTEKPKRATSTRSRAAKADAADAATAEKKPATRKRATKPKAEGEE
jgi:large subunit ribosomal protein L21